MSILFMCWVYICLSIINQVEVELFYFVITYTVGITCCACHNLLRITLDAVILPDVLLYVTRCFVHRFAVAWIFGCPLPTPLAAVTFCLPIIELSLLCTIIALFYRQMPHSRHIFVYN